MEKRRTVGVTKVASDITIITILTPAMDVCHFPRDGMSLFNDGAPLDWVAGKSFLYEVQYEQQLMAQLAQVGIWKRAESPAQAAVINGFDLIH